MGRLASNQFLPPTQSSCIPATGGQGYWDGAGNPGIAWLSLKWLVAALALKAEWSQVCEIQLVLTTWISGIAQESADLWYKAHNPNNYALS